MVSRSKQVLRFKRELNKIAEVGWQEKKTTKFILKSLPGKPIALGFGKEKTGLLYRLGGGTEKILLRADIDGLKIADRVAHICGHSSHAAGLMGGYLDCYSYQNKLTSIRKTIYFLFQPAEETFPSGAKTFIQEYGKIIREVKYAFAVHVRPKMAEGVIGIKKGPIMARGDYMEIFIKGKMVHVKNTPQGIDALEAAAYLILFIKDLQKKYRSNIRINIGVASGGWQPNTVAETASLKGDIRMKEEKYQGLIKRLLVNGVREIEKKTRAKISLNYYDGYPILSNEQTLTQEIIAFMKKRERFKINQSPSLFSFGCEDFSFIAQKISSVYALIGTGDKVDLHQKDCRISDKGTINVYRYFKAVIDWWFEKR